MKKLLTSLLMVAFLFSCNKEVDSVELPPFSVYPNPFVETFSVFVAPQIQGTATVKILSGADEVIVEQQNLTAGSNFTVNMADREKGIYYVELTSGGATFTHPILKAE